MIFHRMYHCQPGETNRLISHNKNITKSCIITSIDSVLNFEKCLAKNRFTDAFIVRWFALFFVISSALTKSGIIETANCVCFDATFANDSPSKYLNSSMARLLVQYE